MDIVAVGSRPEPSFVPESCTLPNEERPLRVAEFAELFKSAVRGAVRTSPTRLHLILEADPATESVARDLAARETECCSFFAFTFQSAEVAALGGTLQVTVDVPPAHVAVLDGLQRLAETAAEPA